MKIIKITEVENCAEGSVGYDIYFNQNIDLNFAEYLGQLGKYIFDESFEKAFFKVIVRGYYTLKGSIGNDNLRILVPETISKEIINEFYEYLEKYQ